VALELDINDLTLGDLEKLEEACGRPAGKVIADFEKGNIVAKDLTALVWVFKSRTDPEFTLDDARSIKLTDLDGDDAGPLPDAALGAAT
jgi:hypothetical protein